ncbi:MAG: DUF192 domain-containing protein [Rhodospirillales bacterium]
MFNRTAFLPAVAVLVVLFAGLAVRGVGATLPVEELVVETQNGRVVLTAEVADTPETRQRGLMFRESLEWRHGMLFDFRVERPVTFWMKNTPLALDMLFIGADGVIDGIAADVQPFDETMRASPGPVRAVLELRGGASERFGIRSGDRVRHRIFGD